MPLSRKLALYIVEGKASLDDVVLLLTKYKLLALLPSIKDALKQLITREHSNTTIRIESPFALSDHAITKIKSIVGEQDAPHDVVIKKSILAGFKAKYKGMMYDGSAERIIKQLSK